LAIRWNSVAGRLYAVNGSTTIGASATWAPVASNLPGTGGLMEYTDTNAVVRLFYYRIAVRQP
jgi:hypothetical protein